jgi:hypothetical protein
MDAASKKLYSHKIKTAEQLSEAIGQRPAQTKSHYVSRHF